MRNQLNMLINLGPYLGLSGWALYLSFGIESNNECNCDDRNPAQSKCFAIAQYVQPA
jgi:hypothetical protein